MKFLLELMSQTEVFTQELDVPYDDEPPQRNIGKTSTCLKQSTFVCVLRKDRQLISPFTYLTKTQKNVLMEESTPSNQTYRASNNWYLKTLNDSLKHVLFVGIGYITESISKGEWWTPITNIEALA